MNANIPVFNNALNTGVPAVIDPFGGVLLPALSPVLSLVAVIALAAFIFRKAFELSFGK